MTEMTEGADKTTLPGGQQGASTSMAAQGKLGLRAEIVKSYLGLWPARSTYVRASAAISTASPSRKATWSRRAMAAIRPVNSSHWCTDLVTTWAASTSGGGGASAWLLPQAVMTVAMTTISEKTRAQRREQVMAVRHERPLDRLVMLRL